MINIFNLFLTLFSFWVLFAYSNDSLSWFYIFFGLASSMIVSFIAWKMKIINKYSHFLFLHIGFYRHFIGIIISSFAESLLIIFRAATSSSKIDCKTYSFPAKKLDNSELVLLMSTINLSPGTVFVGLEDQQITIFYLGIKYMERLNLDKIYDSLEKINDNRLV